MESLLRVSVKKRVFAHTCNVSAHLPPCPFSPGGRESAHHRSHTQTPTETCLPVICVPEAGISLDRAAILHAVSLGVSYRSARLYGPPPRGRYPHTHAQGHTHREPYINAAPAGKGDATPRAPAPLKTEVRERTVGASSRTSLLSESGKSIQMAPDIRWCCGACHKGDTLTLRYLRRRQRSRHREEKQILSVPDRFSSLCRLRWRLLNPELQQQRTSPGDPCAIRGPTAAACPRGWAQLRLRLTMQSHIAYTLFCLVG